MLPAIAGILQIHAQQGPTVSSPALPALNGTNAGNFWSRAGNTLVSGTNNIFGTLWNSEVYHYTGGTLKFTTTVNNGLTNQSIGYNFNTVAKTGDGISVAAGVGSDTRASIDLFTSTQNETYFRMDGTSLMQTRASRMEHIANLNGFWYNATGNGANNANGQFIPQYIWNITGNERGRLGSNGFWHFGNNAINANNTIEIESSALSPYGLTGSGLRFTNLTSANATIPNTNNGVNNRKVLTVDQNGDVVLTDAGTAGNNGISVTNLGFAQLGVDCNSTVQEKIANSLTSNRMIHLAGNNMIFADGGRVGIGIGLLNCNVGNKLEITSGPGMPYYLTGAAGTGSSGLRLTFLTSAKTPIANGFNGVDNTKVLSVDANGDVVLVNASGGNLGNTCGATQQNPLLNDWEIPMNGKNYTFSDPLTTLNYGQNTVRIGSACNSPLFNAKLEVIRNVTSFPNTIHTLVGVGSINSDNFPSLVVGDKSYAGYFVSDGGSSIAPTNYSNYGVVGIAKDARVNYGGYFEAKGTKSMGYGIFAKAASSTTNPGGGSLAGYFDGDVIVNGPFSNFSNQILSDKNIKTAITPINSNIDLINKLRPVSFKYDNTYAPQLRVDNNLSYGFIAQEVGAVLPELIKSINIPEELDTLGNIINPAKTLATLNYDGLIPFAIGGIQELNAKQKEMQASIDKINLSDAQVKTNVNTFNALATVKTLSPVKYNFTNANVPQLNFKPNTDYGFIAQQMETVYPELVDTVRVDATYDSLGVVVNPARVLKTVNYKAMTALLVRSVQEQQQTIDSLRNTQNAILQQLAALAAQINSCCSTTTSRNGNTNINQLDVELSDKDAIVLNQNVPNPFAEQTIITYNVPTNVVKAQLLFYNAEGKLIQTVDITTRGKGKINVFANDLSSGLYHYTLVVDGKVADSKKMIRE